MDRSQLLKAIVLKRTSSVRWAFDFGSWNPTETELIQASRCIQFEEKERIGRFVYKKDAKASLIGRLMMRKFISESTDIPYDKIVFDRDNLGKPYLINDLENLEYKPYFNISHQGNFTVLAGEICKDELKLGVDVMKLEYTGGKGIYEFFRIMSRQFSAKEWETIRGVSNSFSETRLKEENMLSMFCRNWCLKESYVKAIGTGITMDLQKISFNIYSETLSTNCVTADSTVCVNGAVLNDWIFEESLIDKEHCVAVALSKTKETHSEHSETESTVFKHVNFDEIISGSIPVINEDVEYCSNFLLKEEKPI